ncbi:hypothetical protein B0H14DRAFT_3483874 [Mycena olivaceomarginata]|nr:hypothetical protein B0H14DRAFT_3483874 [Mycena olivaceomarginata]
MTDELGRTRRIFHNGILRYRKQLPSETNALPISQTPSSLSNSLPRHCQQDTMVPRLYSHLLPTTQGRIHISDDRDRHSPRHGRYASPTLHDTTGPHLWQSAWPTPSVAVSIRPLAPGGPCPCLMPIQRRGRTYPDTRLLLRFTRRID